MKITFYKAWICRHGFRDGIPNTLTLTASYWHTAEMAEDHYGEQFVKLDEEQSLSWEKTEDELPNLGC